MSKSNVLTAGYLERIRGNICISIINNWLSVNPFPVKAGSFVFSLLVPFAPRGFSLEPSWMILYKGLAYFVYLESLGVVLYIAITARPENRSLGIVDLEQVLIHFISENDRSASQLLIGWVQAMTRGR